MSKFYIGYVVGVSKSIYICNIILIFRHMLRVKEICRQRGISQAELAKEMGVSASALNQSIVGNPSLDKLKEIAKALEVSISELVGDDISNNIITCPNCGVRLIMKKEDDCLLKAK